MTPRRQLGAILQESGRITQEDVDRVLEHQRTHGGFFGQGLVALGVVSREEIDWALASHFDLPFIFPNADAVDHEAAHLVAPEWALAHLAVPIVRAGRSLTIVVAEPLRNDVIEDLAMRTGCTIEMALASASRIRELIHAIYDSALPSRVDDVAPVTFSEFIGHALEHGADRFGVSIRSGTGLGWWRTRMEMHRQPLVDGWELSVPEVMEPSPLERLRDAPGPRAECDVVFHRASGDITLHVQALSGAGGSELLFRPQQRAAVVMTPGSLSLPASVATELRLLARSGKARIGVGAAQVDTARAVLPQLPTLALGAHVRAAHVNESGAGAAYTLRAERDSDFAELVAAYELDALTIDLPAQGYPVQRLLRAAPIAFMILDEPEERAAPGDWGINWLLTISGQPGSYAWDLRALHG